MLKLSLPSFPILHSQRLSLTELSCNDTIDIQRLRSDAQVNTFLQRSRAISVDEAKHFISKIQSGLNKEWLYWKLSLKASDQLIGTICIWNITEEQAVGELGYELFTEHQGKGLMQEAVFAVIEFAFYTVGFRTLTAFPEHGNARSIHLLQKFHFRRDDAFTYLDEPLSGQYSSYYLLKEEFMRRFPAEVS